MIGVAQGVHNQNSRIYIRGLILNQGGDLFFNFWVVSHTGCEYNLNGI